MQVAEKTSLLRAGDMLGCYRIEGLLGQGGFGVTYSALDTNLQWRVAIKEYMPEQFASRCPDNSLEPRSPQEHKMFKWGLSRFIKEAQTLAKFKHPNIVRVMAVFEQNGTAYMVMEYEKGLDLKQLSGTPVFGNEVTLRGMAKPIIDGLSLVHERGYIHRDIKPANILIRENGTPVLLDFGSARQSSVDQTRALTALVTVGFAPLEQYNDGEGRHQGPWTDIYGLAAVLYFLITGNAPVDSTLRGSAVLNNRSDPLKPLVMIKPEGFSEPFCQAIDWALSFKVKDRPQTLHEWRSHLLSSADHAGREQAFPDWTVIQPRPPTLPVAEGGEARNTANYSRASGRSNTPARSAAQRERSLPSSSEISAEPQTGPRGKKQGTGRSDIRQGQRAQSVQLEGGEVGARKRKSHPKVVKPSKMRWVVPLVLILLLSGGGAGYWFVTHAGLAQRTAQSDAARRELALQARAAAARAAEERGAQIRAAEKQAAEQRAAEQRAAEQRAAEQRAAEQRAAEKRAAEKRAAEKRAAEKRAAEKRAAEAQAAQERQDNLRSQKITDQDVSQVLQRFSALREAIESKDLETVRSLTVDSGRKYAYLGYLFGNFDSIKVSIASIRISFGEQKIQSTLQIEKMQRANGDIVFPPPEFRAIPIDSTRLQAWSKINW